MHHMTKSLILLLFAALITYLPITAQAEITAQVSVKAEKGYGRIVLRFFERPSYRVKISDGVLIISFNEVINLKIEQFMKPLSEYFTVGRADPDGKSYRFALTQKMKLHTIEAGERLFIDLLPETWVGLPPSLPQNVIDELSAMARIDDEEKRKMVRRQAFQKSKIILKVRVGQYPTFSRLVFDWREKVGVKVSRSGNILNIQFDKLIRSDISRLKVDPPKFVTGAKSKLTDRGLEVDIILNEGANIRAFREGFAYVVDVSGPLDEEEQEQAEKTAILTPKKDGNSTASNLGTRSEVIEFEAEPRSKTPVKKAKPQTMPDKKVVAAETAMKKPDMKKTMAAIASGKFSPGTLVATKILQKNVGAVPRDTQQVVSKSAGGQVKKPKMVVNKTSKSGGNSVAVKVEPSSQTPVKTAPKQVQIQKLEKAKEKPSPKATAKPMPKTKVAVSTPSKMPVGANKQPSLKVETELVSGNVQLKFPFSEDVPAAVFQRGENLWMVFDTRLELDLSELSDGRKKYDRIAGYKTIRTKKSIAVLLQLKRPSLTTAARVGTGWMLTVGDFIVTPVKPITLMPGERSDGLAKVTMNLNKPASLHVFNDPEVGDNLAVITAFGAPQGIVKPQRFVEFQTISTAHGAAVRPIVDDLDIQVNSDEVVITRAEGLIISSADGNEIMGSRRIAVDVNRPGNIDFAQWAQGGITKFNNRRAELEFEIASKSDVKNSVMARMELARLYVGNQLGAEALGTMEILKAINPKVENDPLFHALRGIANLMMHRLKAARFDLASHALSRDKDAKLWLGLLEVAEGNWVQARLNFSNGESAMKNYPEEIKALFRIRAARANIEVNDISNARFQLAAMPKINLKRKYAAEAAFLNGRLLELLERYDNALDFYDEALSYGDRMIESETSFFKTMLQLRLGSIKPEEALDQLESQLIVWRGDETELKVMRELARLYVARNKYRRGLETMRTAATYYPDEKIGRLIQDDMVNLFSRLFLGDKFNTLSPIESLSLYYDFRELTPIGRLGDEMIRRLSDSLIAVDLLDQAAEILSHQVEKRLKGAARAQVATKLAMVHMFRRKPKKALTAIRRTRQAILPKRIVRRRALMEARALSELGRHKQAVSILANLEGNDIEKARATAMWKGKDWQNAGEAYERVIGEAWRGNNSLTDTQRGDVLRAAISYTLADDKLGIERLRSKFSAKMASTSDIQTFKVITSSDDGRDAEFRNIAKRIASIDTLRGFLEEFQKAEIPLNEDKAAVPQS